MNQTRVLAVVLLWFVCQNSKLVCSPGRVQSRMVGVDVPAGGEVDHELIRASLLFVLGGPILVALCPAVWSSHDEICLKNSIRKMDSDSVTPICTGIVIL